MLRALLLEGSEPVETESIALTFYRNLPGELLWLTEMIYHLNACLRTKFTLTDSEFEHLLELTNEINAIFTEELKQFLIPAGSVAAMQAHLLRVEAKSLVRLLYRWSEAGHAVNPKLIDWTNLLSGFFFHCSVLINHAEGIAEETFESRNYK